MGVAHNRPAVRQRRRLSGAWASILHNRALHQRAYDHWVRFATGGYAAQPRMTSRKIGAYVDVVRAHLSYELDGFLWELLLR
jgi:hypothetical protein